MKRTMVVDITSAINLLFRGAKNVWKNCCSSVQDGSGVTHIYNNVNCCNSIDSFDVPDPLPLKEFDDELFEMEFESVNSPLEQFEIVPLIDLKIGNLYFSFTNPSLFMLLTLSLFLLLVHFFLITRRSPTAVSTLFSTP